MRAIARRLDRSASTVSRELGRNQDPDSGQYRPFTAQRLAAGRRARAGRGKLLRDPVLCQFVADRLEKRWSPEQISQALRREYPDDPGRHVVHETTTRRSTALSWAGCTVACPGTADWPAPPQAAPSPGRPPGRALIGMTMISQRPAEAAARTLPGHWEGDLITGTSNQSAIGTLVDRASRFTILVHLPGRRHTAEAVRDALVQAMAALPAELRRSLTWDQGKELALHAEIAQTLGMPVFFCDPIALAAADQREHQRPAAPVLSQGQRPARA